MLIDYIFTDDAKILMFGQIDELIGRLRFEHIQGPERGKLNREAREVLEDRFGKTVGLSHNLFKKRIDRMMWELILFVDFQVIKEVVGERMLTRGESST